VGDNANTASALSDSAKLASETLLMPTSHCLCKYDLAMPPTALTSSSHCFRQRWHLLSAVSDIPDADFALPLTVLMPTN
jgi:hypothetical protein